MPKRLNIPPEAGRSGQVNGHTAQRAIYLARVAAVLEQELAPLTSRVPLVDTANERLGPVYPLSGYRD